MQLCSRRARLGERGRELEHRCLMAIPRRAMFGHHLSLKAQKLGFVQCQFDLPSARLLLGIPRSYLRLDTGQYTSLLRYLEGLSSLVPVCVAQTDCGWQAANREPRTANRYLCFSDRRHAGTPLVHDTRQGKVGWVLVLVVQDFKLSLNGR
ncbi:hypothetical protein F4780DRAFT_443113 [Xylariomycetidae sp. FL0641]|nr:hypothetical protein F4780DRAFT_443113 [Xylariomycetidae sp. FL0641]